MQPGSTVDDPEQACETLIFSGGGFSNIFPSACFHLIIVIETTDKINNSGCLNSRKMLLNFIRGNI